MGSPLATRLRAAMQGTGNPALENRGLTTEEIGATADAAITIERLKQENLDLMEIHALEQDIALIQEDGEAVEELETATQEITELKADLESYRESGGLTMRDATHIQRQLRSMSRRFGFQVMEMPAMESFRGSTTDRIALTVALEESSDNFIVRAWKAIKKFFVDMWEKVKGWFGKSKDKAEEVSKNLDDVLKKMDGSYKLDSLSSFKSVIGATAYDNLGENFEATKLVETFKTQATTTQNMFKKANVQSANTEWSTIATNVGNILVQGARATSVGTTVETVRGLVMSLSGGKDNFTSEEKTEGDSKEQTFTAKSPVLGGKVLTIKFTEDTKANTISVSSSSADEKGDDANKGKGKPKENEKVEASALKQSVEAVNGALKDYVVITGLLKPSAEAVLKLLDKSPNFGEGDDKASEDDQKSIKAEIEKLKTAGKTIINPPFLSLAGDLIAKANALVSAINKAEKADNK